MRRKLSSREIVLLLILLVLVLASAYYLWFFVPMQERRDSLEGQILSTQDEIELDQLRIARKKEMERELAEIFEKDSDPVGMAPYDNSRNVMFALNSILSDTQDYSLDFASAASAEESGVMRRSISMQFTAPNYAAAKETLQQLHDIPFRCMFDDLSINVTETGGLTIGGLGWWTGGRTIASGMESGPEDETAVRVTATLLFFEYQPQE